MIYFIAKRDNQHPLKIYLSEYHKNELPKIELVSYDEITNYSFTNKTVIFCDLERFDEKNFNTIKSYYDLVSNQKPKLILNPPSKIKGRHESNQVFFNNKLCTYRTHKPPFELDKIKFPAFIRRRYEHYGMSRIFESVEEFNIANKNHGDYDFSDKLFVEYIPCNDKTSQSLFIKFGCFYINGQVIPRHYLVSDSWIVKSSIDSRNIDKEKEYQIMNPHHEFIIKAFKVSGLDYGRIDYSFDQYNQVQTFEINTNPTIIDEEDLENTKRMENTLRFTRMFKEALFNLDTN